MSIALKAVRSLPCSEASQHRECAHQPQEALIALITLSSSYSLYSSLGKSFGNSTTKERCSLHGVDAHIYDKVEKRGRQCSKRTVSVIKLGNTSPTSETNKREREEQLINISHSELNFQPVLSGGERQLVNDRLETAGCANTCYYEHTLFGRARPALLRLGLARQFLEASSPVGRLAITIQNKILIISVLRIFRFTFDRSLFNLI